MSILFICLLALFIGCYCGSYALKIYRENNRAGAIAVGIVGILTIISPFITYSIR